MHEEPERPTPDQSVDPTAAELATFLRSVGRQVRWLRFRHDLTQDELATAAGMSRSFVSLIEQGEHGMNLVRLHGLCRALGLEPWELLRAAAEGAVR
jgi:transcriptional regulator with XRE-family HTH domain